MFRRMSTSRWFCLVFSIVLLASLFSPNSPSASASTGSLKVHMLSQDDGRNDSFIFELPNGEVMVLDNYDSSALLTKLSSLGLSHVDYVVGTHRHVDHIGGQIGRGQGAHYE